jgi:hypothetical protein
MGRNRSKRLRAETKPPVAADPSSRPKVNWLIHTGLAIVIIALGLTGWLIQRIPANPSLPSASHRLTVEAPLHTQFQIEPQTLDELLDLAPELLADVDIARVNLLCATGLPGAEHLDIDHALATLDQWARRVRFETERHLYRVTDPRYSAHYRHSEAYFRAELLLQVLQQDLGVKYDMTVADNFAFDDSRVAFIHGMIPGPAQAIVDTSGGTCASMPVMYVAVGRRLGYPLRLVTTNSHIFVRWDGHGHPNPAWRERFNIEGSGEGFHSFDDDYYLTWPVPITEHEARVNGHLVSLTPMQELAEFLSARGHCAMDNGQYAFAARCYENAYRYDTRRPAYRSWFIEAARLSGYRPVTPALASMINRPARPLLADMQRPSEAMRRAELPGVLPASRIGAWPAEPSAPNVPAFGNPVVPLSQPMEPLQPLGSQP